MLVPRLIITGFIWVMMAIMLNLITDPGFNGDSTALGLGVIVAAMVSTIAVWGTIGDQLYAGERDSEKQKRNAVSNDTRVQLLMQMLNEDEKQRLKQRLLNETRMDGELSVDDLMAQESRYWRDVD